jgi:hypothetical protein
MSDNNDAANADEKSALIEEQPKDPSQKAGSKP